MVVVDEKNRDRVAKKEMEQNDQAVTVAFYGEEMQENMPLAHLSRRSPLTMVFSLLCQYSLNFHV